MRSFQTSSNSSVGAFNGWNNNLATISLDTNWGGLITTLTKRYSCVKSKTNSTTSTSLPVVHFDTLEKYIKFMSDRLDPRVKQILEIGLAKYYVCFWPESNISPVFTS